MTDYQIANQTNAPSTGAQIANSIVNGKNIPIITITGGIVLIALIGLQAYAIYKKVKTNISIKDGFSVSFSPEPDIQFVFIEKASTSCCN